MKGIRCILLMLTALIAISCSKNNSEGPGPLKSYIFFEPRMMDIVETKADLITELPQSDGTSFGVLGFYEDNALIFDEYTDDIAKVYRASGIYKYDNLAPWLGSTHTFHAFYPYDDLVGDVKVGTDNVPYIEYTQPTTAEAMTDILGTYLQTDKVASVKLRFQHLLWAFNIVFKNSQTQEITASGEITDPHIKIREVTLKLQDFPSGAFLYLNPEFTVTANNSSDKSYTIYSASEGTQIDKGKSYTFGPLLFIPVSQLKYQVTIKYATQGDVSDTYVYPAEGQYKTVSSTFQRGKAYDLTIEKKNDKFFVGIEPGEWTSKDVEHSFD